MVIAVQDDRTAITPISVVSKIRSVLNPSTARKYWAPIEGIQSACSTNCQLASSLSYQNHSGSDTRKPSPTKMLAIHLIRFSRCRFTNSRTPTPTSGVNRISDNSGKSAALFMVFCQAQRPVRE